MLIRYSWVLLVIVVSVCCPDVGWGAGKIQKKKTEAPPPQSTAIAIEEISLESLLPRFVDFEKTTFTMGAWEDESDFVWVDSERQHEVTLSPFSFAKTAVTQLLWLKIKEENPSRFAEEKYCPKTFIKVRVGKKEVPVCPHHPVENVSWNEVQDFLVLLNQQTLGKGFVYRLPTEAQQEYAFRGGTIQTFPFGDRGSPTVGKYGAELQAYLVPPDAYWNGLRKLLGRVDQPFAVADKVPNSYGIYRSNIWEWGQDWYDFFGSRPKTDPQGPTDGESKVVRGGSWLCLRYQDWEYFRSAARLAHNPDWKADDIGFRLGRTPQY